MPFANFEPRPILYLAHNLVKYKFQVKMLTYQYPECISRLRNCTAADVEEPGCPPRMHMENLREQKMEIAI